MKNKKQKEWDKMKSEVDSWGDGLGYPIDKGIKEAVIVWNLLGYPTDSSCEGHFYNKKGYGEPHPWLHLSVVNSPTFKKEGKIISVFERKIKIKTKNEFRKKFGKDEFLWTDDVYKQWLKKYYETIKSESTKEYKNAFKKMSKANRLLEFKVRKVLKEFYKHAKLNNFSYKVDFFGSEHIVEISPNKVPKFRGEKDKNRRNKFVKETRKEMNKITKFLRNKFFNVT